MDPEPDRLIGLFVTDLLVSDVVAAPGPQLGRHLSAVIIGVRLVLAHDHHLAPPHRWSRALDPGFRIAEAFAHLPANKPEARSDSSKYVFLLQQYFW